MLKRLSYLKFSVQELFLRRFQRFDFIGSKEKNLSVYHNSKKGNSGYCPNLPLNINVEVTSKCNLSCKMCNIHHNTKGGININDRLLEQTFELAKTANMVSPFGLGESLLYPKIAKIIGKYKSLGPMVSIITNGMLLNENISRELIMQGLDHLGISVDSAEQALLTEIRRGADLNKISNNIMKLNKLKKSLNSKNPVLSLNVVVQKSNFNQLPQIIQLAEKWGIPSVDFLPITTHKHISNIQNESLKSGLPNWNEIMERCYKEADLRGINIDTQRLYYVLSGSAPFKVYKEIASCPEPFRFMMIRANGDIFPCCNWDVNQPIAKFPKNLKKAWQSSDWHSLRKDIVSNSYPGLCKICMGEFTRPFQDEKQS